jgi:1,4-dihydroxy-2-naphthoate octaprenyltransferase
MWVATWTAIGVAALAGIGLAILTGPLVLVIGAASIMAMLGYVGGPVPYGYRGLGEVFVFVFFGLVATAGSRYVHDGSVDGASWLLAVPVGLMAAAILVVNNLRDLETDRRVGKRTLAVKMGDHGTRTFYRSLLAISYAWVGGGVATGVVSPWTLLILATVPFALRLGRLIGNVSDRASMAPALGATARLHLVMGVLLALGTIIGSL